MKRQKIIACVILLLVLLAGGTFYRYHPQEAIITATGTVEVTTADITPKVSGYLTELGLKEGDIVQAGQQVARIERKDLEFQVAQEERALDRSTYQLTDLEKGARQQEVRQIQAKLSAAQSVYRKTQVDYERYSKLFETGAISAQQLDTAKATRDVAYNDVAVLTENLSLLVEGSRIDQIMAQQQEVERSTYVLATSKSLLADTLIAAPLSGLITSKNYENHEYVNPGAPIATILDLNDCWVKVYIASPQIGLVKVGQKADVLIDALPGKSFSGTIKEVSTRAEFTPHNTVTQRERAQQVFAIKVKVDNGEGYLKPGMPADVIIQPLEQEVK